MTWAACCYLCGCEGHNTAPAPAASTHAEEIKRLRDEIDALRGIDSSEVARLKEEAARPRDDYEEGAIAVALYYAFHVDEVESDPVVMLGQIMRALKGRANPEKLLRMIKERLEKEPDAIPAQDV